MIQHRAGTIPHPIRTAKGASTLLKAQVGAHGHVPRLGRIFFLITFFIFTGCATTPKTQSLLALRVARLHTALQHIAESYVNKDMTRLLLYVDPSLSTRSSFRDPIEQDFKAFEMALNMRINRVEVLPSMIRVEVSWEGRWTVSPVSPSSGAPLYQTGHALMEWNLDESPRLLEIRGEIPWGVPPLGGFQNG